MGNVQVTNKFWIAMFLIYSQMGVVDSAFDMVPTLRGSASSTTQS